MKKIKLLFAAMAAMVGLSANAQLTDGTVYWLQDVATGQFISQGANWGTQATVQDVGGLGAQAVYVSDGVYKLKNIMWNKVNSADLGLRTSDRFWDQAPGEVTLEAVEGGYKLNTSGGYLCNNGDTNGDGVKRLGSTGEAAEATVWRFLTKSEYDAAIQAYKDAKAASYATALGYSAASVSALEALITDVDQFISKDYTSSITNPTLASSWDGWSHAAASGSNRSEGNGVGSGCAEFWNGCGAANQTVSGLPNGLYKVEFVGTFRPSGSDNAKKLTSDQTSSPAFVYANDAQVEFLHWIDVPAQANGRGGVTVANGYNNTLYTYVTDGTLKIGIVQGCWENGNMWCPFGQFRLTYYTDQVADEDITALIATIPAEGTVPTSVYSNLTTLKNTLESSKTIAAFNALSAAITDANTLVSSYTAFLFTKDDAEIVGVAAATINEQTTAANAATTSAEIEAATTALHTAVVAAAAGLDYFDITTFTITNASPYANGNNWTATNGTRLNEWASNPVTYDSGNKCAEMWNNIGASMLYTITNLPAGRYRLTAIAAARDNSGSVLKVGDKTVGLVSVGSLNSRAEVGEWFNNGGGVNELFFNLDATATELTIGLVAGTSGDAWTLWRSFKLETLDESIAASYLAPGYATLVEEATATFNNTAYANVTGDERTALETALAATPVTIADYETAVEALNNAVAAFTAAAPAYDFYAKERAIADAISSTDIVVAAPTTADGCIPAVKALKVAEYNYVATAYPYSATAKIGDFSTWTRTGTVNGSTKNDFEALTSQHWSGEARLYYEQPAGGWGSNSWTANYTKTTTLPAGNYIIKVAARAASSGGTTADINCTATSLTSPIPAWGDTGKGVTKAGVASFDEGEFCNDGNGRGWVWNYLPFTLTEEAEVTMTVVAEGKGQYQWFSVCDGELLSANDIATAVAYDEAVANTIEDVALANVTMTRAIKASFNTVVLPFALTSSQVQTAFGSGTEVYAFSENSDDPNDVTINFDKVVAGTISANVPVLVRATQASASQVFNGVQVVASTTDVQVAGKNVTFKGVYAPSTVIDGDYFVGNGALYKSAGSTNIKAFRAYIDAQGASSVKMFIGDTETSIEEINGMETENGVIYNLAGQRISKVQKGINIINGRKVLY